MAYGSRVAMPDSLRKALTLLSVVAPFRPLVGPVRVSVEVSARCNYSCLMCPTYSPLTDVAERPHTGLMDIDIATSVIHSAARMRAKLVSFVGRGEPLLHPHLASIVRLATDLGLETEVFTNGSLLTQKRTEGLVAAGLGTLAVSLVAASAESYARVHPGTSAETFHQVLDSVAYLQELKRRLGVRTPRVDLRFIEVEGSHLEVEKMVDLGIKLGADSIHLNPLRNRSVGDIGTIGPREEEEKLTIDRLRELAPVAARAGLETNLDELIVFHALGPVSSTFPCYAGWFESRPLVDGTVEYCVRCKRIVGDVRERSLYETWLAPELQSLRRLARNPADRDKVGQCDCVRCCHFYSNWRITRFLSIFGLAPSIGRVVKGYSLPAAQH